MPRILALGAVALCLAMAPAAAEEVTLAHGDLTVNANLMTTEGASLADGAVLITHGTLAHNRMEIIATLQTLLEERGIASLAINLSLGLSNRHGSYDCATPHRHRHEDAVTEIGLWLAWLKDRGAGPVVLAGHSRGGNQAAWFAAEHGDAPFMGVALIAPSVWDAAAAARRYDERYGSPLAPLLAEAGRLVKGGQGDTMLEVTHVLYCRAATVSAATIQSYYRDDPRKDTPGLLARLGKPVLVIAGSEDKVVEGLAERVAPLADGERVRFLEIDGADHYFRDLYAEDVADAIAELMGK